MNLPWRYFFGFGEICYIDNEVAGIEYGYFLVVYILGMNLYCGIYYSVYFFCDENYMVFVFA
jgi:hypothetical protein